MVEDRLLAEGPQPTVELSPGRYQILLVVRDPADHVSTDEVTVIVNARFIRGDGNGDLVVDVSDAIKVLLFLFAGAQLPCPDAADANDDGVLNITDPIAILGYLFTATNPPPPSPFPDPGSDPTEDGLNCTGG